jgi:COMM domain
VTGPGPALHGFAGQSPPKHVTDGWGRFLEFPAEAQPDFWDLVVSAVLQPADPGHRERFALFRQRHELPEGDLVAAIQACGVLLRQACAHDLDRERFGRDLAALSNGRAAATAPLLDRYDDIKRHVRQQLVAEALADHGKVLVGIDWRVDRVVNSSKGANLDATVVVLTFRYREGDRLERITLQLTPEALSELKAFTERIDG